MSGVLPSLNVSRSSACLMIGRLHLVRLARPVILVERACVSVRDRRVKTELRGLVGKTLVMLVALMLGAVYLIVRVTQSLL
jgi:hypothetical protein